jgi:hypothetical protein
MVKKAQKAINKSGNFYINGKSVQLSKHRPIERKQEREQTFNYLVQEK